MIRKKTEMDNLMYFFKEKYMHFYFFKKNSFCINDNELDTSVGVS